MKIHHHYKDQRNRSKKEYSVTCRVHFDNGNYGYAMFILKLRKSFTSKMIIESLKEKFDIKSVVILNVLPL